jgi:hypothetical protein
MRPRRARAHSPPEASRSRPTAPCSTRSPAATSGTTAGGPFAATARSSQSSRSFRFERPRIPSRNLWPEESPSLERTSPVARSTRCFRRHPAKAATWWRQRPAPSRPLDIPTQPLDNRAVVIARLRPISQASTPLGPSGSVRLRTGCTSAVYGRQANSRSRSPGVATREEWVPPSSTSSSSRPSTSALEGPQPCVEPFIRDHTPRRRGAPGFFPRSRTARRAVDRRRERTSGWAFSHAT